MAGIEVTGRGHGRWRWCALLGAITLLGAILRLWALGAKSLWIDEAFSVWIARQPLAQGIAWLVQVDQHPPLYYALLRLLVRLDDGEATVRLISALASTLTIPATYGLAQRLAGRRVAALSALILALSPFHVRFAQEARMYALLCLWVSLSLWALAHLLTDSRAQRAAGAQLRRARGTGRVGGSLSRARDPSTDAAWCGYVLCTAAALWTHNTAVLYLLVSNSIVCGLWLARRRGRGTGRLTAPHVVSWLGAQLAVLALWVPWARAFVAQSAAVYRSFWLPAPSVQTIATALGGFLCAFVPSQIGWQWAIWAGYGVLLLLGAFSLRSRPALLWFLALAALLPIGAALLISVARPIFYDRTLIWATIPLYVLLALGVARLRYRSFVTAALVMLVTLNLVALREYYLHFEKEQWDLAAAHVASRAEEDDLLLFHATWAQIPFDYYLSETEIRVEERGIPVDLFARGVIEPEMTPADLPYLRALIAHRRRVWLVYSHHWATDPEGLVARALAAELTLAEKRRYNGLEVRLYVAGEP